MIEFGLSIPVYWTDVKKTKKSPTHLVSMNFYRNAHHFTNNKMKKHIEDIIKAQLPNVKIQGKYRVSYIYYFKNPKSDLMNVVSLMSKFLNDAMQEAGVVEDDNVQHLIAEYTEIGGLDKLNPRCEVYVEEVPDD